MAKITVTFPIRIDGVYTSVTSVHLQSEDGTYGVKKTISGDVVVANGTPMVETSTGIYEYTFTGPDALTAYTQSVRMVYDGVTSFSTSTYSAPSVAVVGELSVAPLFNTEEVLLNRIRMATTVDSQTYAAIDTAIMDVRLGFFNKLTKDRALQIAGYADSTSPTTENEVLKANAAICEVYWVLHQLTALLPTMFLENLSNVRDNFNEEPLTRDSSALLEYRSGLWSKVQELLGLLEEPVVNAGTTNVAGIGRVDSNGDDDPYIIDNNFIGLGIGRIER